MNMIEATSATELLKRLTALDISVPLRTEGRTKDHGERAWICRFLATFAETGLLDFPLCVDHIDRPDIVLHLPSSSIGLEITEAVPKNWAHADGGDLGTGETWGRTSKYKHSIELSEILVFF